MSLGLWIRIWRHSDLLQLKLDRAKERESAIKKGLMADPNQPTSLNQAITPVGTCTSMCPDFERVERIVQKMVDKSEKVPTSRLAINVPQAYGYYLSFFTQRQIRYNIWKRRCSSGSEDRLPVMTNSFRPTFEHPTHSFRPRITLFDMSLEALSLSA